MLTQLEALAQWSVAVTLFTDEERAVARLRLAAFGFGVRI